MPELYYPELSYVIVGTAFEIYNELGFGYQEKYYYRAFEQKLRGKKLNIKKQLCNEIIIQGKSIGRYFLDFLINDKIVLELKVANNIYPKHIKQVLGYLKAHNLKLGIIVALPRMEYS